MPELATPPQYSPPPTAPVYRTPARAGFSPIWIVPLVSALLGLWLFGRYYSAKGPVITVRFENADGIIAGKTPVLCRSVNIGTVSDLELSSDNKSVIVKLAMTSEAKRLLVEDSQIWVERARYSAAGISGLNTLVSGNFIQFQPGISKKARRDFTGLENPPPTPPGVPGLHFKLIAAEAGGLGAGAPIMYKGIQVGKLESRAFHTEPAQVEFDAFIEGAYVTLVNQETRFYNSGGLDLKIGAEGVQMRLGTLESLLTSSITFTDPDPNQQHVKSIPNGQSFMLYSSLSDAKKVDFNPTIPYLLLFTGSVRGLSPDAPVEFRGIRIGSVVAASFKYLPDDPEHRVPVLIKIDPAVLMGKPGGDQTSTQVLITDGVAHGLRASLKTGSLLTGQLFVELDFVKDAPPAVITGVGDYAVLPTVPATGLDELQEKAGALLDKFKALPVEQIGENANAALASIKDAAGHIDKLTGPNSSLDKTLNNTQKLTSELNATVSDLSVQFKQVGANLSQATDTVKHQPWRLIWPTTKKYPTDGAATPAPDKKKATPVPRKKH
ncbi:MAG: MlaD family protein [Chthoniobacter sp.]|uniref:PqiB family protein n=1 Tax=Chthoniobacter sp. TaxID=2510640 RepID=UPI0032A331B2